MSALGKLPPVDFAIHADTSWERSETYAFARKWMPWLMRHGIRVATVQPAEKRRNPFYSVNVSSTFLPAFTISLADGTHGQLRRQCTGAWKITPIRRFVSHLLKAQGESKQPGTVEQWIGITLDEAHRARQNDVQYIVNRHPFLEMLA